MTGYAEAIEKDGFRVITGVFGAETVEALRNCLARVEGDEAVRRRSGAAYGVRDLLRLVPAVRELADGSDLRALVEPILGSGARVVRGIYFDKTPEANWSVPWHQDLTLAVRAQVPVEGWGPWSVKAGIVHVQPPATVLQSGLTLRVHLDDTDPSNGALQVIPGSHQAGRLPADQIRRWRAERGSVCCTVAEGGVLAMRPLILHASGAAVSPRHRRVLHLEYSSATLPDGLEWHS